MLRDSLNYKRRFLHLQFLKPFPTCGLTCAVRPFAQTVPPPLSQATRLSAGVSLEFRL